MACFVAADESSTPFACEIDEFEIQKTIRASWLHSITLYKHIHEPKKTLGFSMSDSTLSVIEESILKDSELQTPNFDLGFPASFEVLPTDDLPLFESQSPRFALGYPASFETLDSSDLPLPKSQSPNFDLGFPASFEALLTRDLPLSGRQSHRAELGFLALFDASGCDDKKRV